MRYQEPLMFRLADGLASPACLDGSGAGAGSSGCQTGDIFVEEGPLADCANGNEDNYCLDGFYIPPSGFTDQCSLGANALTTTTRCSTGSSAT